MTTVTELVREMQSGYSADFDVRQPMSSDAELRAAEHEKYREQFLQSYRIRCVEKQLLQLFKQGKVHGTIHTSIGQELSAVLVAQRLASDDVVFSNHRCHGHYIAKTGDVRGLIAEIMGKASGACQGIGGSQHLCNHGFFSNGIQGGIVPVSAGIALHHKLEGTGGIAVVYMGDGTLGEGVVYESMNMASLWNLPVLFIVEDNMYAQSTPSSKSSTGSCAGRAGAFGISYHEGSIWDVHALDATVAAAVTEVREQRKPALLRIRLYRLEAHSKGDDDRDPQEIAHYKSKDPLTTFLRDTAGDPKTQQALAAVEQEVGAHIDALEREPISTRDFATHLPVNVTTALRPAVAEAVPQVKAINAALDEFMKSQPTSVIIGEDIHSPYGGAFKVTKDLSFRYSDRVFTSPISEAGIAGIANGLALMGRRVVVEIMFGDFITLAFDQLVNHAAKFKHMYGDEKRVPVILRTPMGGGRGYGPTHSQSLEKHLAGVPGTQLFVLHGRANVSSFYTQLLSSCDTPSVVIENKTLYTKAANQQLPDTHTLFESEETFPTSVLKPATPADITLVAFGGTSAIAEEAAKRLQEEEEIAVEIILPLQVYPLNIATILESVRSTRRVVVLEEGAHGFNLGAEVIARLSEQWDEKDAFKAARVAAKETALPSALPLERRVLPSANELFEICVEVYGD
jgi:2-oxoisovalerate dehydrogenase E1 component